MPLGPGTRLGPYEIQSAIGAGGMGEVYRARDTRLKRDVALKVLPDSFATDPDRPTKLFQPPYFGNGGNPGRTYDVSADGQRFLMIKQAGADQGGTPPQIVVVQNWGEELKRLVPSK